jgi:hypothetical protein
MVDIKCAELAGGRTRGRGQLRPRDWIDRTLVRESAELISRRDNEDKPRSPELDTLIDHWQGQPAMRNPGCRGSVVKNRFVNSTVAFATMRKPLPLLIY